MAWILFPILLYTYHTRIIAAAPRTYVLHVLLRQLLPTPRPGRYTAPSPRLKYTSQFVNALLAPNVFQPHNLNTPVNAPPNTAFSTNLLACVITTIITEHHHH